MTLSAKMRDLKSRMTRGPWRGQTNSGYIYGDGAVVAHVGAFARKGWRIEVQHTNSGLAAAFIVEGPIGDYTNADALAASIVALHPGDRGEQQDSKGE